MYVAKLPAITAHSIQGRRNKRGELYMFFFVAVLFLPGTLAAFEFGEL